MTSPGPRGREAVETVLAYSGGVIDRAASQRSDPGFLEVIEARWFTRAELAEHAAAAGRLGREDSIDKYLLRSWLEETT
jgi:hypothetical protein